VHHPPTNSLSKPLVIEDGARKSYASIARNLSLAIQGFDDNKC
jgi:hypothetical protein